MSFLSPTLNAIKKAPKNVLSGVLSPLSGLIPSSSFSQSNEYQTAISPEDQQALQLRQQAATAQQQEGVQSVQNFFNDPATEMRLQQQVDAERAGGLAALADSARGAERGNRFALARQGLLGGSQEAVRNQQLATNVQRGAIGVEQRAQSLQSQLRSQNEASRQGLIQLLMDPNQLQNMAEQARQSGYSAQSQSLQQLSSIAQQQTQLQQFYQQQLGSLIGGGLSSVGNTVGNYIRDRAQQQTQDATLKLLQNAGGAQ